MDIIIAFAITISAFTMGVVELVKKSTNVPTRFVPLISVAVGIVVSLGVYFVPELQADLSLSGHLTGGFMVGLAASGLYSLATGTTKKEKKL